MFLCFELSESSPPDVLPSASSSCLIWGRFSLPFVYILDSNIACPRLSHVLVMDSEVDLPSSTFTSGWVPSGRTGLPGCLGGWTAGGAILSATSRPISGIGAGTVMSLDQGPAERCAWGLIVPTGQGVSSRNMIHPQKKQTPVFIHCDRWSPLE